MGTTKEAHDLGPSKILEMQISAITLPTARMQTAVAFYSLLRSDGDRHGQADLSRG
jgi:hypothetical protein